MAEGGNFSSLRYGSDAYFDNVCTHCAEEEAVMYCIECQEYLCKTCTRHHDRQRPTRSPKLQRIFTEYQSSVAALTRNGRFHPSEKIDFDCKDHDMFFCATCNNHNHRKFEKVILGEDVKSPFSPVNEIQMSLQALSKRLDEELNKILERFSEMRQNNTQKLYQAKLKKDINVDIKTDTKTCFITGMCQLPDGTIILYDRDNLKVKRLDMDYNIKDHCDLDACPSGICCTGENEVAVKMFSNKVQFISVGSSLSTLRQISIEDGVYFGMAYCAGELWISSISGVNVYSTSGTLRKTISTDLNGRKLFESSCKQMAVIGETVIVTDSSNGAVFLGRNGTVIREIRDDRLVDTTGVCVSADDNVFLSGSNNIVMFDGNGKCLGELVDKNAGLVKPVSLFYDDRSCCLIVTCRSSNNILVFDIAG